MPLGLGSDRGNAKVIEAMKTVVDACSRHDRVAGILAATPEEAERALKMGFRFVGLGSDTRFLMAGAKIFLDSIRRDNQQEDQERRDLRSFSRAGSTW